MTTLLESGFIDTFRFQIQIKKMLTLGGPIALKPERKTLAGALIIFSFPLI